jgi:hypothetical protein
MAKSDERMYIAVSVDTMVLEGRGGSMATGSLYGDTASVPGGNGSVLEDNGSVAEQSVVTEYGDSKPT